MAITILGTAYGRKTPVRPTFADVPFGPCADGTSAFCEGAGTEVVDPAAMADLSTAFRTIIVCGACRTLRASDFSWN